MSETDDDMHQADIRNGEPGATGWTETDDPDEGLDRDPEPGQLPSDTDVQAERQPE